MLFERDKLPMLIRAGFYRSVEMDITVIGLQNAGKTSLVRVLAVSSLSRSTPKE